MPLRLRQGDADIAEWINKQPNITEAIFRLIRAEMAQNPLQDIIDRLERIEQKLDAGVELAPKTDHPSADREGDRPAGYREESAVVPEQQEEAIHISQQDLDMAMSMFDFD